MSQGISEIETRVLALVQNRQIQQIRTGDLVRLLNVSAEQERKVLSGMARRGIAARVRRGLYLMPPVLPLGGRWSPGEALALTALMNDREARYQICGPNTFYRYGWDEQVPNRIYAYNNRITGDRSIGQIELTFIKVSDDRLGDTESVTTPDGNDLVYSTRIRSLVDAVYDWSRFNSLPQAFGWVRDDLAEGRIQVVDLVEAALKFSNQGTLRRIGYLLEKLSDEMPVPVRLVARLERELRSSSSTIPWIPTMTKRGQVNKRWGLVVNDRVTSTA